MSIVYRLIQCVLLPILTVRLVWMRLRGALNGADLRESLIGPAGQGPVIWVHGASLGEVTSARPVIAALAEHHRVLVTTTRKPAKIAVNAWGVDGVTAALAPLDTTLVTRAMLRRFRVKALIVLENELWPARMMAAHAMDVPVVLLSARMSAGTAKVWSRLPRLAASVLGPVAQVWPQDAGSASRLQTLGVSPDRTHPVVKLKSAYAAPPVTLPAAFVDWSRANTWLAAATHDKEEQIVLSAFVRARQDRPGLRLIIAPRHTERSDAVARLITGAGYADLRRSRQDAPTGLVYLADTLGEMPLWYTLAGVAFVGGSLVPAGGHTPYEPAAHSCPILHGPYVRNFAEDYAAFKATDAAVEVSNEAELAQAIDTHINDQEMADRAKIIAQSTDFDALILSISRALS